jgi:hypothetical protein
MYVEDYKLSITIQIQFKKNRLQKDKAGYTWYNKTNLLSFSKL